jgi:hypothetical protein
LLKNPPILFRVGGKLLRPRRDVGNDLVAEVVEGAGGERCQNE